MQHRHRAYWADVIVCFALTTGILLLIFYLYGLAPFGDNTLAMMDARLQYLDFFAYLKDVLSGENNISYSFSKTLGGTNTAVFSYYLASPLNLLVVFFDKTELNSFFDLLVVLKLGLAAATMRIFLGGRWGGEYSPKSAKYVGQYSDRNSFANSCSCRPEGFGTLQRVLALLLSLCYALSQYAIAQSSNIMWLDGMYLLPLILLGVYRVSQGRSGLLLTISVALSLLFNWYTGAINCLASAVWIVWELVYGKNKKQLFLRLVRYALSMFWGLCLSACLFVPTLAALEKSNRGSIDWSRFRDLGLTGPISTVFRGFQPGAVSVAGSVSLFCGSLVTVGCIALLLKRRIPLGHKLLFGALLCWTVLMFYWKPLFFLFSLCKDATSYYYRYAYVGIFFLIYTASAFYLHYVPGAAGQKQKCRGQQDARQSITEQQDIKQPGKPRLRRGLEVLAGVLLSLAVVTELSYNVKLQLDSYHDDDVEDYRIYTLEQEAQIARLKELDGGSYRITQTRSRDVRENHLTAGYDEALAYNYWSISGYTSSPDDIQRELLDRLGYRMNGENMCIVDTSIISADALLGVRYVLSEMAINGYTVVDDETHNDKIIYENPYALPLAFTYPDADLTTGQTADETEQTAQTQQTPEETATAQPTEETAQTTEETAQTTGETTQESQNPFEYQNELYSQLMGEPVSIFQKVESSVQLSAAGEPTYTLFVPSGNYALYGNLPWNTEFDGEIDVAGAYSTSYACWLSPSVFYIPSSQGGGKITIAVTSENTCDLQQGGEQFYVLDLDAFAKVTQTLQQKAAEYSIANGEAQIRVSVREGERLFVSIPYDSGWVITVDGEETEAELFADCLYSLKLSAGEHEIRMVYHAEGLLPGMICSIIGLLGTVGTALCTASQKISITKDKEKRSDSQK